ncbi:hypothetical protein RISK_001648 [Rhodopirellula islandica]|uniref:Uncharacterized protein n=1 Tax=Rhodopirellula islandica TaxID=595434 RepID=A0A0J1BIT0_RHOIS|nr:hypothetical protein RISK_001648 [Rhodopirellula islandica]
MLPRATMSSVVQVVAIMGILRTIPMNTGTVIARAVHLETRSNCLLPWEFTRTITAVIRMLAKQRHRSLPHKTRSRIQANSPTNPNPRTILIRVGFANRSRPQQAWLISPKRRSTANGLSSLIGRLAIPRTSDGLSLGHLFVARLRFESESPSLRSC